LTDKRNKSINNPGRAVVVKAKKTVKPVKVVEPKTSTDRVQKLNAALLESGGRILNRVRLSKEAVDSLGYLCDGYYESERAAIDDSLIELAKRKKARVANGKK